MLAIQCAQQHVLKAIAASAESPKQAPWPQHSGDHSKDMAQKAQECRSLLLVPGLRLYQAALTKLV